MKLNGLVMTCLAISSLLMQACDKQQPMESSASIADNETLSLEKDFGGFTASDEAAMLSDEELLAEIVEDKNVSDPLFNEAAENSTSSSGTRAYEVRVTWGMLERDPTATELIDWSGSVQVSRGVLAVLRTIHFEDELHGDRLHLPRPNPRELAFSSYTDTHSDGLLLLVIDRGLSEAPGRLTIQAGKYTRTFTFGELASLNLIEPVGPNANAVSIISRNRTARPVAGGFLTGRWAKKGAGEGKLYGRWIDGEGATVGVLRGIWGERRDGEKVFFAKYVDLHGEYGGLLAGHWSYDGDERSGVFEGEWFSRDRQESGVVSGHFQPGRHGRGFFSGLWF